MMWNYRVMKTSDEFVLREVYYNDNGEVETWTAGPAIPAADTLDGLKWLVDRYREALEKSVIEER